jgi:hypothetical protein
MRTRTAAVIRCWARRSDGSTRKRSPGELDVAFAPDFFEGEHEQFVFTGDSHVGTLMVNALVGLIASDTGLRAFGFVNERVGIRGDVRYVRSFQNQIPSWTRGITVDVAPGNFDFWRAAAGVTFRWGE